MGSAWAILVGNRPPVSDSVSGVALLALFAPYCGSLDIEQDLRSALQNPMAGEFRGIRPLEGMVACLSADLGGLAYPTGNGDLSTGLDGEPSLTALSWSPISWCSG